jgi:putative spermidine/putrescine transport system permease protein
MSRTFLVLVVAVYVFLLSPLFVVVAVSFSDSSVASFPPSAVSLRWYVRALTLDLFVKGLLNSVILGLIAAAMSTALGTAAALALARSRLPAAEVVQALFLSPLVVPGVVVGIALLAASATVGLHDAPVRLGLAHVVICLPYSVRTVLASLARLDPSIEDAALTLGAGPWKAFWSVTLPLIRPGIAAGAIFAFVMSFDNVPVSIFLADARTTTLPLAIISYLEYNFDPSVAAISSLMILFALGFAVLLDRIFGLKRALAA